MLAGIARAAGSTHDQAKILVSEIVVGRHHLNRLAVGIESDALET